MIAAVVQIRMGSTRLPNKAFLDLCGHPLIYHVVSRLQQCKNLDQIIVATTDNKIDDDIQKWCVRNNIDCYRGDEEDVLKRYYNCATAFNLDIIVRITGDDPFKDFNLIDKAVECAIENKVDFVCNNSPVTYPEGLDVEVITYNALKQIHDNADKPEHREHVTLYIHENKAAFKVLNHTDSIDRSSYRWTIDYPKDYQFVKVIYEELFKEGELFQTQEIYDLLRKKPQLQLINNSLNRSMLYEKRD
jgi:spore coat polysaccharide biosynthesis protein SpsF